MRRLYDVHIWLLYFFGNRGRVVKEIVSKRIYGLAKLCEAAIRRNSVSLYADDPSQFQVEYHHVFLSYKYLARGFVKSKF